MQPLPHNRLQLERCTAVETPLAIKNGPDLFREAQEGRREEEEEEEEPD